MDFSPLGISMYAMKLSLLWLAGAALAAEVFDTRTVLGSAGALAIVGATTWLTIRSNAIKFWKGEAEVARVRAERMEKERDEQRELKHEALNELSGLRMKTDLAPVLEALAGVQQGLAERELDRLAITDALGEVKEALHVQTVLLERLVEGLEGRL